MAFGALLFGFMQRSALILDLRDVPKEIVTIIQGIVVLAVVIVYEVVSKYVQRRVDRLCRGGDRLRPGHLGGGGMSTLVDRYRKADRGVRVVVIAVAAVLVMTLAELVTGTSDLTSRSTASAALRLAIPILLAGLGGLYSERSGVVNIGLEGMMISGTWFAAWGAWMFGPWQGVILGVLGGAIFGLLHALATVTFNVDHIVSGVAINILGLGAMRFLSSIVYTPETGGSVIQSPPIDGLPNIDLPFLAGGQLFGWDSPDFFGWLENLELFFLSDVAGILRGFTGGIELAHSAGLALVPFTVWLLWKTPWGLRLRSCGEDPWAAESLGVRVLRMKYYGVIISGMLSGLAGAFLVLVQAGIYREGMTRRPRIHRSWRFDLRQLDAGWSPRWVPGLRLRRLPSIPWPGGGEIVHPGRCDRADRLWDLLRCSVETARRHHPDS